MGKTATSSAVLRENAQKLVEKLSLSDIYQVLLTMPDVPWEEHLDAVFDRAERARLKDAILGSTMLPAHLYIIDAIVADHGVTGPLLDCLIRAVRTLVASMPEQFVGTPQTSL